MMTTAKRAIMPVTLALLLAACGGGQDAGETPTNATAEAGHSEAEGGHSEGGGAEGKIALNPRQVHPKISSSTC